MSKKEREICEFEMDLKNLFVCALIDCEQSLVFLCKVTARERRSRESRETRITSWFAIALDEIRTRRIFREKADCKQSSALI